MTTHAVIENATCLGCGCTCDDIGVVVEDDRIVDARNACALGIQWFGDGTVPARSLVAARVASHEDALSEATRRLLGAARPLVYLAPGLSCDAQRGGAAIADVLGATLDSVSTATALPVILASQERGYASATLGEVRHRADLVVFWAIDCDRRYPRFTSRYAPDTEGMHVPGGRSSRTVVAVDVGNATSVADADRRIAIDPAEEIATLAALQALVTPRAEGAPDLGAVAGAGWDHARELAPALLAARYGALVYDAEPDERAARSTQRFAALGTLSQALNERTRCAAIAMRAGGNRSGADAILTSQTGYPLAVDFARGYPRYRPYDGSALECLDRRESDVALVLGDAALLPGPVAAALAQVPCIVIGPRASELPLGSAAVAIDTGVAGIHSGGMALRTDDVPLPLRPSLRGPTPVEDLTAALLRALSRAHARR